MRISIHIDVPDGAQVTTEQQTIEQAGRQIFADQLEPLEQAPLPTSPFAGSMQVHGFAPGGGGVQAPFVANGWQVGAVHAPSHKPLKLGKDGRSLFCATKMQDGSWCQFKA